MKATREALGDTLPAMGKLYQNILALDADLGKATKLDAFGKQFPDRFFQMGIAEANMIGVASGLAEQGFKVFLASFASFLTGRYDTIRCSIAYSKAPVVLIGTHGGLAIGRDGVTQMGLEDITLMRALPNMQVYNPASYTEACLLIKHICETKLEYPIYLRLGRQPVPELPSIDNIFHTELIKVELQPDVTIFSTGCITHEVIQALKDPILSKANLNHAHISSIKPLILPNMRIGKLIISVEDHLIAGGFGSALEHELERPVFKIGLNDVWAGSGKPEDLYKEYGLDPASIARKISEWIQDKLQ